MLAPADPTPRDPHRRDVSSRFYSDLPIDFDPHGSTEVRLSGPEAHHLLHVMRATVGARVTLFDGSGAEFPAEVVALGRADATLRVQERVTADREPAIAVTIGVALPKGDRQKTLVEKLTELGVARLTPLETERGVATAKPAALEKLRRLVVEASKQCGRNRLMAIDEATALDRFFEANAEAGERLLAHPGGEPLPERDDSVRSVAIAVGPEGGFTDDEATAAIRGGWRAVSLGERLLRVETAAIACAITRSLPTGVG